MRSTSTCTQEASTNLTEVKRRSRKRRPLQTAVLFSSEMEKHSGKDSTLVQKKESVRGAVGMGQEFEAAVKRMDLVSKTSTTSKMASQTRVSSNSSDTFMTAKSGQESNRDKLGNTRICLS